MQVYQLKVTLRGVRPAIWRRLQVPSTLNLGQLHHVLQISMGWTDSHLHQFSVAGECIGVPDPHDLWGAPAFDERKFRLEQIAQATSRFTYEYDFGDGWTHDVVIEGAEVLPELNPDQICLGGRRACPPEDCGGPYGYGDLLQAVLNPKHPDHAEKLDWLGSHWDPEAFDIDAINKELRPLATRWRPKGAARPRARSRTVSD